MDEQLYALVDPRTREFHYIGKSLDPERRLWAHLSDQDDCDKVRWIRELKAEGLKPDLIICGDGKAELRTIQALFDLGVPLTNQQRGRTEMLQFRATKAERNLLASRAAQAHTTVSGFIRRRCLGSKDD